MICQDAKDGRISYEALHSVKKRATPYQMMLYKTSLQLYKLYNQTEPSYDWIALNLQQNFNRRCDKFMIVENSRLKVGKNLLPHRLGVISYKI